MIVKVFSLASILLIASALNWATPQKTIDDKSRRAERKRAQDAELLRLRTAHELVDRAKSFEDLQSKTTTLVHLADLLWQHPGEEKYAREIFLQLHDELKVSAASQSKLTSPANIRIIPRLQQMVARFVSKHDAKLGAACFEEDLIGDDKSKAARRLDFALDLVSDGNSLEADRFVRSAIDDAFPGLDLRLLLSLLHRLRTLNTDAADSLFLQVLGRVASQPRTSTDDLLLIGNYLFIKEADAGPESVRYTAVTVDAIYFPVGISGERSALSKQLVTSFLETALAVLNHQLSDSSTQFPKRYQAVARMLLEKAQKFAPELVSSFTALAHEFSVTTISAFPALDSQTAGKLIDYDAVVSELENLQGSRHDDRCVALIATAYLQNDLDTASRLSQLITDKTQRTLVQQLIAFRRGSNSLEKDEGTSTEKFASEIQIPELAILLELGLANLELSNRQRSAALVRLQTLVQKLRDNEIPSRGLYLLNIAMLLTRIDANAALEVFDQAAKAFDGSPLGVGDLMKREHLTTIQLGTNKAFFSVNSKSIPFGNFEGSITTLFRRSQEHTLPTLLGMRNEKILGAALIAVSKELLSNSSAAADLNH